MLFYERGANHSIDTSCLVARGNFSQFASNIRKEVISTQETRISMENRKFTASFVRKIATVSSRLRGNQIFLVSFLLIGYERDNAVPVK